MSIRNSNEQYGSLAKTMHWLTAVLIAGAWGLGQGMDLIPKGDARAAGIFIHISLGLAVLLVVGARFAWRAVDPPPPAIPSQFGSLSEKLATLVHYALYALLAAAPIMGIAYWFARGNDLPVFGLFAIPSPLAANCPLASTMIDIHALLANAIVILAGFHALAALAHHYLLHDRTLIRMLPGHYPTAGGMPFRDTASGPRANRPAPRPAGGSPTT